MKCNVMIDRSKGMVSMLATADLRTAFLTLSTVWTVVGTSVGSAVSAARLVKVEAFPSTSMIVEVLSVTGSSVGEGSGLPGSEILLQLRGDNTLIRIQDFDGNQR